MNCSITFLFGNLRDRRIWRLTAIADGGGLDEKARYKKHYLSVNLSIWPDPIRSSICLPKQGKRFRSNLFWLFCLSLRCIAFNASNQTQGHCNRDSAWLSSIKNISSNAFIDCIRLKVPYRAVS